MAGVHRMARVEVAPIALKFRHTADWLLPCPAPIFPGGNPSDVEIELAMALIDALDDRSRAWYQRFFKFDKRPGDLSWTTAMPDWERRLINGESIIPPPIFPNMAAQALAIFKRLRVVDLPGRPTFGECADPFVFDFVAAVFGAYDAETGQQLIREFFMLISKKNTKSTISAGLMVTALVLGWREDEEQMILAPTKEVAGNSFDPAASMVRADDDLRMLFHVAENQRTLTHRVLNAAVKVVAADSDAVSGKKAGRVLVDEQWLFGKRANADTMFMEAFGGQVSREEGWIVKLTTQSDDPPAGVFKEDLGKYRDIRDGNIEDKKKLGILYEFPTAMIESKQYLDSTNWYITNPNLNKSVSLQWLKDKYEDYRDKTDGSLQRFLAKHLNIEIGLNLRSDRWAGADYWQPCASSHRIELAELIARCDAIDIGIDGGGLDDLLGLAVIGRDEETGVWVHWARAWAHPSVLERRKQEAPRFRDFEKDGDLYIVKRIGDDVDQVAQFVAQVYESGKLDKIGVDPHGLGGILDALEAVEVPQEIIVGISQGWKLTGAIKTLERRLAEGTIEHSGSALMAWSVSNAKVEPRGNAITITKQAAGYAKIDPLMATFNAVSLISLNPEGSSTVLKGEGFVSL